MTPSLFLYSINVALIVLGLVFIKMKMNHIGQVMIWVALASIATESIVVNNLDWVSITFIYGLPLAILGIRLKVEGVKKRS